MSIAAAVKRHPPLGYGAGTGEFERDCWMPDPFYCPECDAVLTCDEDYGTGNHYWTLRCAVHGRFTASTYRITVPRRVGMAVAPSRAAVVAGRVRRVDFAVDTGIR